MKEEKVIRKLFWVWNFETEERWLNTMAQSGWVLTKVSFCTYHFSPCQPGEYTIRLEMHAADRDYLSFMEEIGAEYVGRMVQWVYFRRKAELGQFNLFSDIDSKIAHLKKIGNTLEVGMQNDALAISLVSVFFAPAVAIPAAVGCSAML